MRWPVGVLAIAALAGCLPNIRSDEFACASQADCAPDRLCDQGFCIRAECPDDCSSCDLVARTCTIACLGSGDCDNVQCPDGFDCNVLCMVARACDNVDCSGARSCSVTCLGTTACKDITCGEGPCRVTCTGSNACDDVECASSCACDVTCAECSTTSCPDGDSGTCTLDGTSATSCSSIGPGCNSC